MATECPDTASQRVRAAEDIPNVVLLVCSLLFVCGLQALPTEMVGGLGCDAPFLLVAVTLCTSLLCRYTWLGVVTLSFCCISKILCDHVGLLQKLLHMAVDGVFSLGGQFLRHVGGRRISCM